MREIRSLRSKWRGLETGLRQLLNGHEEGNLGYKPRRNLRGTAPVLDPTNQPLRDAHGVGVPEGNMATHAFASARRSRGVEDPMHAERLQAREPGDPVVAHQAIGWAGGRTRGAASPS